MYNTVEELQGIHQILIEQWDKDNIYLPSKGLIIDNYGHKFTYPYNYQNDVDDLYGNVTITGEQLASELVILQDYGDHECPPPENFIEVPRWLLYYDNGSIGWYDGYLCYIAISDNRLIVSKLTEYSKIDINKINSKRPFNFKLLIPKDWKQEDKLIYYIELSIIDKDGHHDFRLIKFESHFTYGELIDPNRLNRLLILANYELGDSSDEIPLSRDLLVSLGFSFDHNSLKWSKGDKFITEDGIDPINNYYRTPKNEYLFTLTDLKKYLQYDKLDPTK